MFNFKRSIVLPAAMALATAVSGSALAAPGHGGWHGGGGHGGGGHWGGHGWGWGAGAVIGGAVVAGALLSPWYYRPYYYDYGPAYPAYYPAPYPVVVESAPSTVYVEQASAPRVAAAPDSGNWWYYCNESRAYYPYVRECPSQWQRVAPQPAAPR